jgi:hypothetical protein
VRVVHRNVALYEATGWLCREVDATARIVEAAGRPHLAHWIRHSALTLALLVSARDPDEERGLEACARIDEDLRVCAAHVGDCAPLLRALAHLERARDLLDRWAGPEGVPRVVTDPVPTAPPVALPEGPPPS